MTINFNWVNAESTNVDRDRVSIKKTKAGERNGVQRYSAGITLPAAVMKDARLVIGDRALIGIAHDLKMGRCIAIKRVNKGGHKIGPATSSSKFKGGSKGAEGRTIRGRIQIGWTEDMHEGFEAPVGNCIMMDDGTLVVWEG